jgi:hypothetical protein
MGFGDVGEALEDGVYPLFTEPDQEAVRVVERMVTVQDDKHDKDAVKQVLERVYLDTQFGATVFVTDIKEKGKVRVEQDQTIQ